MNRHLEDLDGIAAGVQQGERATQTIRALRRHSEINLIRRPKHARVRPRQLHRDANVHRPILTALRRASLHRIRVVHLDADARLVVPRLIHRHAHHEHGARRSGREDPRRSRKRSKASRRSPRRALADPIRRRVGLLDTGRRALDGVRDDRGIERGGGVVAGIVAAIFRLRRQCEMDERIRRNRLDDAKRRGVRIVHVQSPHVRHPSGQSHADQRLHLIGGVDPDTPGVEEKASLLRDQHERAHRHTERPWRVRHEYLATPPRGNLKRGQVTRRALRLKRHAVRGEAEHPERLRRVRVKHGEVRIRDGTQRLVPEVDLHGLDGDRGRPIRSGLKILFVHIDALFDVIARARRARRRTHLRAP